MIMFAPTLVLILNLEYDFQCTCFILHKCWRTNNRLFVGPNAVFVSAKKPFQMFQKGLMQYNKSI